MKNIGKWFLDYWIHEGSLYNGTVNDRIECLVSNRRPDQILILRYTPLSTKRLVSNRLPGQIVILRHKPLAIKRLVPNKRSALNARLLDISKKLFHNSTLNFTSLYFKSLGNKKDTSEI